VSSSASSHPLIRAVLVGVTGRMGRELLRAAPGFAQLILTGAIASPASRCASALPENQGHQRENGTERTSATAVTPNPFNSGMASQCDVARRPLSRPAAARITDPEHTDVVQLAVRWARRNHSSSASSRACTGVDGPPGTRITSGEGVSANEWVAPMTSTPESAVIGPDSCHTNLTSASGRFRSTS